jgi:hypothetical protein
MLAMSVLSKDLDRPPVEQPMLLVLPEKPVCLSSREGHGLQVLREGMFDGVDKVGDLLLVKPDNAAALVLLYFVFAVTWHCFPLCLSRIVFRPDLAGQRHVEERYGGASHHGHLPIKKASLRAPRL